MSENMRHLPYVALSLVLSACLPIADPRDATCPASAEAGATDAATRDTGTLDTDAARAAANDAATDVGAGRPDPALAAAAALVEEGRHTFRYDTFGDEAFWGGQLRLHAAVAGAANGGVGTGLSPLAALRLGLKVDVDALPTELAGRLARGEIDLEDPATTLALLRAQSVVGVTGVFAADGSLDSIGIQCALCHSTVDDAMSPGIGHRLDGWPNRDLDVGRIIALSPSLAPFTAALGVSDTTVRSILRSWGPGRFDAELMLDGRATRPDGGNASTLIPALFGIAGADRQTYTGWGSATYWNALVANLVMHGQGTFYDPRLDDASQFPLAAHARLGHVQATGEDRITPRLAALDFYQRSLPVPTPPANFFDPAAAARGAVLFAGPARCTECHVLPLTTEPGRNLHAAAELGIDDFQASRSPEHAYRTTPLRGLFTRRRGGFYHDGRFATLSDLVAHYEQRMSLRLTHDECIDLVNYLMSL